MNGLEQKGVADWDIEVVKAGVPYLKASEFKDNQVLRGVTVTELVAHNPANTVTDMKTGEERTFKENWIVGVEFEKRNYYLRLTSKDIVAIRDDLKYGKAMTQWIGKKVDLIVKQYNVGKGFGIIV